MLKYKKSYACIHIMVGSYREENLYVRKETRQ